MTKHTAVFAIFDRAQYEAYADTNCSSAHLDHTTLGAGDRIKCLARIELRTKIHAGRWQFEVVREDSTNRSSVDLSEPLINHPPRSSSLSRIHPIQTLLAWLTSPIQETWKAQALTAGSLSRPDSDSCR